MSRPSARSTRRFSSHDPPPSPFVSSPVPRRILHDRYFKQAKAEGYLARSAYKLLEIQQRKPILRAGDLVLDVGCAPGSWLQVASGIVGPRGLVVGIDLQPVTHAIAPNVRTIVADINQTDAPARLASLLDPRPAADPTNRRFDAVISDMAPNTTGAGDALRSARLCQRLMDLLPALLRPAGNLTMKVLEGATFPDLLARTRASFAEARAFKPKASRDASTEIFIIATGFRPHAAPRSDNPA